MKHSRLFWGLLLVLALTNCGTTSISTGSPSASPTALTQPNTLHVTRPVVSGFPFPPLERIIRDAVAVQHLYTSAYVLPIPNPGGVINCSSDIRMVYHMDFFHGSILIQRMSLDATGCQILHIGQTETRFTHEDFRSLFIKTIGIPSLVPGVT